MDAIEMRPGFFYFCHPYSAATKVGRISNFELCCRRSARLLLKGYNIFSPIVHSYPIEIASPEMLLQSNEELWKFWLDVDVSILEFVQFTGVILAPEWHESRGCLREYKWFISNRRNDGSRYDILKYNDIIGD